MHHIITLFNNTLSIGILNIRKLFTNTTSSSNFKLVGIIVLLLLSFGLSTSAQLNKDKKGDGIKPGKRQAVLVLSDGRTIVLSANDSLNYSNKDKFKSAPDSLKAFPLSNATKKPTTTSYLLPNNNCIKNTSKHKNEITKE
ncbi:hypothetical protein [Carboxylicivirga marina]|uniref:Uncharacterized protein n=1 Tax=Carboxylicivirga marina TaxID=2800988 RepID=A0ABS1HFA8_9BACT|nr:hypothetical protein [Carboxylicivirga marina]MBK3516327.1 hypothetical protein [Carboxylicivirga marina]